MCIYSCEYRYLMLACFSRPTRVRQLTISHFYVLKRRSHPSRVRQAKMWWSKNGWFIVMCFVVTRRCFPSSWIPCRTCIVNWKLCCLSLKLQRRKLPAARSECVNAALVNSTTSWTDQPDTECCCWICFCPCLRCECVVSCVGSATLGWRSIKLAT